MVLLRTNPVEMDARFLLFALQSDAVQHEILSHEGTGSTVSNLRIPSLKALRIPAPPLPEQRAIAHILGTLDDKIELNRRTNETLEAMARALFKSWFVDFDPVHAKKAGRKPEGMDAETAALFPDDFEDSEMGKIPRGWRALNVGACATLKRGTTYDGMLVGKPGPALLGLGSIRPGGGFRGEKFKTYGGDCPAGLMLFPGDMYVSLKGATKDGEMIGSVARVPASVPSGRLTQDTVKLELADRVHSHFLYRLLLTPAYRSYCAGRAMGSAVVALSRDDFLSYPLALAPVQVLRAFDLIADRLDCRAQLLDVESATLRTTRDALLPQLLSGSLRVPEAMRLVEKVL